MARPIGVCETPALVDADARFMRVEIVAVDETHVIRGDDGDADLACEPHASLHALFLTGSRRSDQLEVIALRKHRLPVCE